MIKIICPICFGDKKVYKMDDTYPGPEEDCPACDEDGYINAPIGTKVSTAIQETIKNFPDHCAV